MRKAYRFLTFLGICLTLSSTAACGKLASAVSKVVSEHKSESSESEEEESTVEAVEETTTEAETEAETEEETTAEETTEEETETAAYEFAVGDEVAFGSYEQDNDEEDGKEPIVWVIIDIQGDEGLLLSTYCLDNMSYNYDASVRNWADSSIREWLNEDFYNEAFSPEEQASVVETMLEDTEDNVFLLSKEEVEYYLDSEYKIAANTDYAEERMFEEMLKSGFYASTESEVRAKAAEWDAKYGMENASWWWTRTPAGNRVDPSGEQAFEGGSEADAEVNSLNSVRPAIWVKLY